MPRRFISQMSDQENVNQIFRASDKQLRPNRNGNLYLQVQLSDRSGILAARMWNAGEDTYRGFENGDFVKVEGTTQVYQGALQMIATSLHRVPPADVNLSDFMVLTPRQIDDLVLKLTEMLREFANPYLRALGESYLMDGQFMKKLTRAPAGVKHHHAYHGGLLEHVVNLMNVVRSVRGFYPAIDPEIFLMGAFVHDLGKIDELGYDRDLHYTDEGQLIGHLVMGVSTLDAKAKEAEKLLGEAIPEELVLRLKHVIVSHHGEYEFGSPKLPMTLEAIALHFLDSMDAKVHAFEQIMRDDPTMEGNWTQYHQNLGRKLFKGITSQG